MSDAINVQVIALSGRDVAIQNFTDVQELNEYTYNLQDGYDFKLVATWRSKDGREAVEVYVSPDYVTRKEVE